MVDGYAITCYIPSHRIHVWYIIMLLYANIGGILMVNVTIYSIRLMTNVYLYV